MGKMIMVGKLIEKLTQLRIHVMCTDTGGDQRLLLPKRINDRRNTRRAWRDIAKIDQGLLDLQLLAQIIDRILGSKLQRRIQRDEVGDQCAVLHLDQSYNDRTCRTDHREDLTLLIFGKALYLGLLFMKHLTRGRYISRIPDGLVKDVVESHLADTLHDIDTRGAVFKLRKNRRANYRDFDLTAGGRKTFLKRIGHGDLGVIGADTDTLGAVDTADVVDRRFSAAHADRLCRASLTAGGTSDTKIPYQRYTV